MTNDVLAELGTTAAALAKAARQLAHRAEQTNGLDASDLRGVVTMMEGAADAVVSALRRYPSATKPDVPPAAVTQARVFIAAAVSLAGAADQVDDCDVVAVSSRELRRYRAEGEAAYRQSLVSLVGSPREPIHVAMWRRDLHQRLSWAVERCGHAGRLLEGCCVPAARA